MFLKYYKPLKIDPPLQHKVLQLFGANDLIFKSLFIYFLISFINLTGNPSNKQVPPLNTISYKIVLLRSMSIFYTAFMNN